MLGGQFRRRLAGAAIGLALLVLAAAGCSSPAGPTPPAPGAPSITCPADITAQSKDGNGLAQTYQLPVASGGSAPVNVVCAPAPGSVFAPGDTRVNCTATDSLAKTGACSFLIRVTIPPRLKFTKFMAFGDSMTAGKAGTVYAFDVENLPGSYPNDLYAELTARYTAQSFVMSPQGWAGEPTSTAVTRLQTTLPTVRPEVVLLMDGANDLFGGDPEAIAPARENMRQMVLMSKTFGAQVFLANLPPQVQGGSRAKGYWLVDTYNAELAEVAQETAVPLVDVNKALKVDPATYIDKDGLHPTKAGYQKIADTFFASIQALLETSPGTSLTAPAGPFRLSR